MIDWIIRDESLHLSFGICLINQLLKENPEIKSGEFLNKVRKLIVEAVQKEEAFNKSMLPKPLIGVSADTLNQYVRYIADRRMKELGLEPYYNANNPLKWMAVELDAPALVNIFEAKYTGYEVGLS